jgi:hypothetical protein
VDALIKLTQFAAGVGHNPNLIYFDNAMSANDSQRNERQ